MEQGQETAQKLSCRRCQTRKIKCDRRYPCSNCAHHKATCEFRSQDGRRRPASHAYITALETRVAWYESLIRKLKNSDTSDHDAILAQVSLDDHLPAQDPISDTAGPSTGVSQDEGLSPAAVGSLKQGPSGTLQYHGATSVYLDDDLDDASLFSPPKAMSSAHSWSDYRLATVLGIDGALINEGLSLFFMHQYPQFMFVYREAFLADYFTSEHGGQYWSFSLLYALCALGAMHSSNPETRSKSLLLAKCSQEIIVTHELSLSAFTTVQALLCLAFYKLGCGSSSEGWLFSGMAFRMGQDLGFHRDPRLWIFKDRSILTPSNIEIRRRIYWGCYLADKFISLYMGRPVSLMERDAEVDPVEPLPDFPADHTWFGLNDIVADFASNANQRPQLTIGFQNMVVLGGIFQDFMAIIFSPKRHTNHAIILNHLGKFNLRLTGWFSGLPECLQWSQWAQKTKIEPHVLVLHLFYHTIMISFNRHFIDTSKNSRFQPNQQSQIACATSCDAILAMARQVYNHTPAYKPPIGLLYALTMAAITTIMTPDRESSRPDAKLTFIIKVLGEYIPYFGLATEMRSKLLRYIRSPTLRAHAESKATASVGHNQPSWSNQPVENVVVDDGEGQSPQQPGDPQPALGARPHPAAVPSDIDNIYFPDSAALAEFNLDGEPFLSDPFQDWVFQS